MPPNLLTLFLCRTNVIRWKGAVTFRQRRLTDVIASKLGHMLSRRKGSKSLARVNLTRRGDGFHPRGATYMSASIGWLSDDRINAGVNRAGMKRYTEVEVFRQPSRSPVSF